ncbi:MULTISPECIES: hypothetical protein [Bradyrhizobium]|uniref:Uncharacterized protein n=1 Tax=Bradyrhizobium frederickii TaxID=2560054 RepID=A0A4Y9NIM0_9BRAD|nr:MULTISPECIES: hypothetical protein [Bradyrhizobium]RTE87987.1 hypothetical protein D6B98_38680 [Bradyrhizobium sp. LVM 105]TFV29332.1 hypothetical protein E4K66_38375 [Bradyrhizobium frederickii]TFV67680.1 hypothetical protein E4K64_38155 [Bradyrhizobium frederickii]
MVPLLEAPLGVDEDVGDIQELASGILRITKRLRDELEAALKVIDSLKDHTGFTVAAARPKQRER